MMNLGYLATGLKVLGSYCGKSAEVSPKLTTIENAKYSRSAGYKVGVLYDFYNEYSSLIPGYPYPIALTKDQIQSSDPMLHLMLNNYLSEIWRLINNYESGNFVKDEVRKFEMEQAVKKLDGGME